MKLLVSCIPYDAGKSGISVYVREVVRELSAQGHELTLLVEPESRTESSEVEKLNVEKSKSGSSTHQPFNLSTFQPFNIISAPRWTRRAVFSMLWHLFVLPFWIGRRRREFDGFVICAANRRVCAWYPLPTVATVHDLANFHIPGKYSRSRMFYLAHILPFFAKRAQRLVAVSGATKVDMVKFWNCREEDVTVLYNGLPGETGNRGNGRPARLEIEQENRGNGRPARLEIEQENRGNRTTILYISRIEHPGKNHVRLIEAYSRLPRSLAETHPLVIAGADWKDAGAVHDAAENSPHRDLIRFTGFVDAKDMPALWDEAGFYVFPSLFEGFGLSLVEAMAKGIPCACSNNGSLGEIAGDAAVTFDPESVDSIAAALEKLLREPQAEREARVARGRKWIKRFSWADHARGIAELLDGERAVSRLFGIPVARVTETEAVERIVAMAKSSRNSPVPRSPSFVATLNVDFVANAVDGFPFEGNAELWGYLKNADFVTADGMPIVLLSKLMGKPLPGRVTGADMVPAICRRCAEEGLSVYVLGGDRETVENAFEKLGLDGHSTAGSSRLDGECRMPNVKKPLLAGIDPAFVKLGEDQPEIVERINAAKPDILFVALGNPKQELWMGRNRAKLDAGAMIGIGGTFNFIAGRVKRAPKWMQKSGLEWIYRIIQEPGRLWKRYAYGLVKFGWLSLRSLMGEYK